MFNVTILKMRDLIKYLVGIAITIVIVVVISKQFSKDNNKEEKIVNEVKNGISMLSEQSFLGCFEQAVPTMAYLNEEYSKIAEEDDHSREDILQGILETQISSIKGIETTEKIAESQETETTTENTLNVADNQNSTVGTASQNARYRRSWNKNRSNNK